MAVISFKCPNCDGELIFDPESQQYKCEYCNSLFSQEELDAMKPATASEKQADHTGEAPEAEDVAEGQQESASHQAVQYSCPSSVRKSSRMRRRRRPSATTVTIRWCSAESSRESSFRKR